MRAAAVLALLVALLVAHPVRAQRRETTPPRPVTVAERSGFVATATAADLDAFFAALAENAPPGRLEIGTFGKSEAGRDLVVVRVPPSPPGALAPATVRQPLVGPSVPVRGRVSRWPSFSAFVRR